MKEERDNSQYKGNKRVEYCEARVIKQSRKVTKKFERLFV